MNRAKQIRLDRGLGVYEAADAAGIARRTLRKIEAGDDVHAGSLARLAEFYEVAPSSLLAPAVFAAPGEAA